MRKATEVSTIKTLVDDTEVNLYSKKQSDRFYSHIKERPDSQTKVVKQESDGIIVLHHFFRYEKGWLGYVLLLGPLGGEKTLHDVYVWETQKGELFLSRK